MRFSAIGIKANQWPRFSRTFAHFALLLGFFSSIGVRPCSTEMETSAADDNASLVEDDNGTSFISSYQSYKVVYLNYEYYQIPFLITLWVFVATFAKIGFHTTNKLRRAFPESVLLIVLGMFVAILLSYSRLMTFSPLTPFAFFMILLPPIVLDAGYFMPNRTFFDNLGTILLFAVVGTIFNTVAIGVSLWAVGLTGLYGVEINVLDAFLFSALISAVDPVAVLAVFEEIHVNEVLYILVFGESLLNDAVALVLYNAFAAYRQMGEANIRTTDVVLGVVSFFVVALGGTVIGIVCGFFTGFVTRFTNHVRILEPVIVFAAAYMSYVLAQMYQLSGIMALTFCGICSKNYVEANISLKSHTTLKNAMKMLSSVAETITFLLLGVAVVNDVHLWNTWFVVFTIIFCTVYRIISVVILTPLANHFRVHKLDKVEQFVMSYGGLRGAVAYAMALTISDAVVVHKPMFTTATIATVFFTVFVQGISIKPLVQKLQVKKKEKRKLTMNERIHEKFMYHLTSGIEELVGNVGSHHFRDKYKYYENNYFRKWLLREEVGDEPKILETYSKLNRRDAKQFFTQNGHVDSNTSPEVLNLLLVKNASKSEEQEKQVPRIDVQRPDNDDQLSHLLDDLMQQPRKRNRRYSRTTLFDEDLCSSTDTGKQHGHHHKRRHRSESNYEDAKENPKHLFVQNERQKQSSSHVKLNLEKKNGDDHTDVDDEDVIQFSAQVHENGGEPFSENATPTKTSEVFDSEKSQEDVSSTRENADPQPNESRFLNMFESYVLQCASSGGIDSALLLRERNSVLRVFQSRRN